MVKDTLEDWQLALLVDARKYDNPELLEAEEASEYRDNKSLVKEGTNKDSPVVVERHVKEEYDEAKDLLEAASGIDDWEVVPTEQRAEELEACEAVTDLLSDALKENNGLRDTTVERMDALAMVNQFRDEDDGDIELESLAQQPETGGSVDETETETGDDPDDVESLSATERNEIREKLDLAKRMNQRTPEFAETLRGEAAEIAGVEDVDDIDYEVL